MADVMNGHRHLKNTFLILCIRVTKYILELLYCVQYRELHAVWKNHIAHRYIYSIYVRKKYGKAKDYKKNKETKGKRPRAHCASIPQRANARLPHGLFIKVHRLGRSEAGATAWTRYIYMCGIVEASFLTSFFWCVQKSALPYCAAATCCWNRKLLYNVVYRMLYIQNTHTYTHTLCRAWAKVVKILIRVKNIDGRCCCSAGESKPESSRKEQ